MPLGSAENNLDQTTSELKQKVELLTKENKELSDKLGLLGELTSSFLTFLGSKEQTQFDGLVTLSKEQIKSKYVLSFNTEPSGDSSSTNENDNSSHLEGSVTSEKLEELKYKVRDEIRAKIDKLTQENSILANLVKKQAERLEEVSYDDFLSGVDEPRIETEELESLLSEQEQDFEKLEAELKQKIDELNQSQEQLILLNKNLEETKANLEQVNEVLAQSQISTSQLSNENKELKEKYKNIEITYGNLQKKYGTLEAHLKAKTKEIDKLTTTIDGVQQQFKNGRQEVENLKQELQPKEDRMPPQNTPPDRPLIDLDSDSDSNESLDRIDLHHHPSMSPSPVPSSTHSSFSPSAENREEIARKFDPLLNLDSSGANEASSLTGASYSLKLNQLSSDQSGGSSSLRSREDEAEVKTPPVLLTASMINGDISMQTLEQKVDNLLLDPEFKKSLVDTLNKQLITDYKTALTTELNKSGNSNIVNPLILPESELNKLKCLIGNTVDRLFNNENEKEEIRQVLTQIVDQLEEEVNEVDEISPKFAAEGFLLRFLPGSGTYNAAGADYPCCLEVLSQTFNSNKSNAQQHASHIYIDRIFKKINNGEALSDNEIQKIPPELQYANSADDFWLGLKSFKPDLNESTVFDGIECFQTTRSLLRKNALGIRNDQNLNSEIIRDIKNLDAEAWLKKKLEIMTGGKSIDLELDTDKQNDLNDKFKKLFPLSPIEDMAITHKSVDKLIEELEKTHNFINKKTATRFKKFSEVETQLAAYPPLVNDNAFDEFIANLNEYLPNLLKVNDAQAKVLLAGIERDLENDAFKWYLDSPHYNYKFGKGVSKNILDNKDNSQFEFDKDETLELVMKTLRVLHKNHALKETLDKRKKWQTNIKLSHLFIQNLESFNREINSRVGKLKEMLFLKQPDVNNNLATDTEAKGPGDVYLPHSCSIIPNSDQSYTLSPNFTMKLDGFYKQNALKVGETVTFKQTLSDVQKRNWSVTRTDDKCLAYETHKPWKDVKNNVKERFNCETTYSKEVSFAQMIHGVNSFKEGSICTVEFPKCSNDMEKKLRLFMAAYNELRNNKGPILVGTPNPKLQMKRKDIDAVKNEIKDKLNLYANELSDTTEKLKDDTIHRRIMRLRG